MNVWEDSDEYDTIVLAGVRSPGVVTLSGHERKQDWDIQKPKGQDGGSTKRNGEPVAEFSATFHLVYDPYLDIDDIADWDTFQDLIESSTNGATPVALDIYHPDLARNRITSVVNGGIGGMEHDGKGGQKVTVKFLEYRPPKKKSSTGANGSKKGNGSAGSGVNDPVQERLDEYNKLKNEGSAAP